MTMTPEIVVSEIMNVLGVMVELWKPKWRRWYASGKQLKLSRA